MKSQEQVKVEKVNIIVTGYNSDTGISKEIIQKKNGSKRSCSQAEVMSFEKVSSVEHLESCPSSLLPWRRHKQAGL